MHIRSKVSLPKKQPPAQAAEHECAVIDCQGKSQVAGIGGPDALPYCCQVKVRRQHEEDDDCRARAEARQGLPVAQPCTQGKLYALAWGRHWPKRQGQCAIRKRTGFPCSWLVSRNV